MIEIAAAGTATNGAAAGVAPGHAVPGTNEAVRAPADLQDAPRAETGPLRAACLAVLRERWSTLAVVATDPGAPAARFAAALAEVARAYRLRPVRLVVAPPTPALVAALQDELEAARGGDFRLVVALGDPRRSPDVAPLLVHAEAAVLVVRLGASELASVEAAAELAGRERVLGCVVAR